MNNSKSKFMISKDSKIGEMVHEYPATAEVMLSYGLACVGCSVNLFESVEEGARIHGQMTDKEIDEMLLELNKVAKPARTFKLGDSFMITERALNRIKQVRTEEEKHNFGLEIVVKEQEGDKNYDLEFKKQKTKVQQEYELRGVKFFIDPLSYDLVGGMKLDYVENPFQ